MNTEFFKPAVLTLANALPVTARLRSAVNLS